MKKQDTVKYLMEVTKKALKAEERLIQLPDLDYYPSGSEYFAFLEHRNKYLNMAIRVLNNECGYSIKSLRIHQRDARHVYAAIQCVMTTASANANVM